MKLRNIKFRLKPKNNNEEENAKIAEQILKDLKKGKKNEKI